MIDRVRSAQRTGLRIAELSFDEENLAGGLPAAAERHDPGGLVVAQRLHQRGKAEKLQIAGERRGRTIRRRRDLLAGVGEIFDRGGGDLANALIRKSLRDFSEQRLHRFRKGSVSIGRLVRGYVHRMFRTSAYSRFADPTTNSLSAFPPT